MVRGGRDSAHRRRESLQPAAGSRRPPAPRSLPSVARSGRAAAASCASCSWRVSCFPAQARSSDSDWPCTLIAWLAHQGSVALPLLSTLRIDGQALGLDRPRRRLHRHHLRLAARTQDRQRQSPGDAQGLRPRSRAGPQTRTRPRRSGRHRSRSGLRSAGERRPAAAQLCQSARRRPRLPARPRRLDQGRLRRQRPNPGSQPGQTRRNLPADHRPRERTAWRRSRGHVRLSSAGTEPRMGYTRAAKEKSSLLANCPTRWSM